MKKIALNIVIVLVSIITLVSCDKDFNTIGSDILGDDHFGFEKKDDVSLIAFTKKTGPVQTNNLPVKALGIYDDPYFGTTKATFVTQLSLSLIAPDFGVLETIDIVNATDSVYLYIPYTSTQTEVGTGIEPNTFELGEIYGDEATSLNLKIFESNYLLRDFEANDPSIRKKYYSDEKNLIEGTINASAQLNDVTILDQSTDFKFSNKEILIYKTNANGEFLDSTGAITTDETKKVIKERLKPGMWINLDKDFFETKILKAADSDLLNNNIFKEYFKGLYFQVEANSGSNALALLDLTSAYVNIQYHSKASETAELTKKSFKLNLSGNSVNFFENNYSTSYSSAVDASDPTLGDELLYPKGGDGSVVFIDLFGPDVDNNLIPDELEQLRAQNILVNDAFLTFYVKKDLPNEASKNFSSRIYLYDATNNAPLLDYLFDSSTATDPKENKLLFGGILEVDEDDQGVRYKVRLSNHINKIINGTNADTNKNVRLGLSVTQNINISSMYVIENTSFLLPIGSIMQPKGAVLYGNNVSANDADKKLKLEIYYTKPN